MNKTIDFGTVADLYDIYVQWDADVAFFRETCRGVTDDVLELMCGTGRLSVPLLHSGVVLTCVDYSREMLQVLQRRLHEQGLVAEVREADVRSIDLGRKYPLILLPFHSFSEIVDWNQRAQALGAIRRHLAPHGRFVITLHNPVVQLRRLDGRRRVISRNVMPDRDADLRVWSTAWSRADCQIGEALQEYEVVGHEGAVLERRELRLSFAITNRDVFEAEAAAAGFRVLQLYGDYESRPYEAETSPFMIFELGHAQQ
jgi:SAM-dependent methyltransferase